MLKTTNGIKIICKDSYQETNATPQEITVNARVAQLIYDARTQAGLSQTKLAQMIDTTQPVISRLEDAKYEGHSLSMLSRIARATGREVKIDLVPIKEV